MGARILVLLVILWSLLVSPVAAAISVTVSPQATVSGREIKLGDIAEISGQPEAIAAELAALSLGPAPAPGERVILTPGVLRMRLAGFVPQADINWHLPPQIAVLGASQTVTSQALAAAAEAALKQQLGGLAEQPDTLIQPLSLPKDSVVPPGAVTVTAILPYGLRFSGPTTVDVNVSVDGQSYQWQRLHYTVKVFQNVVVTSRNVQAQEALSADNLRYQRLELGSLPAGYLTDIREAVGKVSRRALPAGSILTSKSIEPPLVIKRGQTVIIAAQTGAITITARGRALEDGRIGETIRVQNITSRKTITATVVDENTVQVVSK